MTTEQPITAEAAQSARNALWVRQNDYENMEAVLADKTVDAFINQAVAEVTALRSQVEALTKERDDLRHSNVGIKVLKDMGFDHGEGVRETLGRFIRENDALKAEVERLRYELKFQADEMCEFGEDDAGCGRYDALTCGGCRARSTLRSAGEGADG